MKLSKKYRVILIFIVLIIFWQLGFFYRYNYFTAKIDILKDQVEIVGFGKPVSYNDEVLKLQKKYGFQIGNAGCCFSYSKKHGVDMYNAEVAKYLKKRNGKNWEEKYNSEESSLIKESDK